MTVAPLRLPGAPAIDNSFDFSPLGKLGQAFAPQDNSLAALAARYGVTLPTSATPVPETSPSFIGPPAPATATPTTGGTTAEFSAPPTSSDVNAAIRATAPIAGMDVPTWKAVASIESSLNPASNYDRSTQYKGLFQVGSRGEGSEWSRHGGNGNIYDAKDNATAAAKLAAENNAQFKATFNRDPTPLETYMMHQQGFGFYKNGTMTNIEGNPYPGMSGPQTPESFAAGWGREIERRAKYFRKSEEADSGY
jgi:hypothetical protein